MRGGMAQSVGHLGRNFKPTRGGMAQSVEHIVHIDGVVGSSPTVTTRAEAVENQRLLLLCLHPGVHGPGVVFVGVNGSDNPNCQNCRLAQLPELSGWLHWWK